MEIVVSSMEPKRDLITLDLLGGCSKDPDLGLKSSLACHSDLPHLDLNLLPAEGPKPAVALPPSLALTQSVCTIEKVKWALERAAQRESRGGDTTEEERLPWRRRVVAERASEASDGGDASPSPSSSSSITTASFKLRPDGEEGSSDGCESASGAAAGCLLAAGCPSCLSYVLISKKNPRCPRCDTEVPPPPLPVPQPQKKPRIDLNFALGPL
ncbi:hypothetical protein Cni_G16617 [Canna indica]|uniref:GIR1-like zinc ribbon domain-containing protein n=1 Tax=Canna indica TaxID=4628 RepID=A0AAQ3KIZ6_9LILI|nr:hypothetical protein Cni_G16617 [Canna indica]